MGNCACQAASRHGTEPAEPWGDGSEPAAAWAERGVSGEERTTGLKATVAVRISKRRLQELMAKAAGGMTVEEVLAEIVSTGEVVFSGRRQHRRWEPALHSIPEAVES